jgi:hypothetical protein
MCLDWFNSVPTLISLEIKAMLSEIVNSLLSLFQHD